MYLNISFKFYYGTGILSMYITNGIKSIAEVAKTISFIKLNDSLVSIFILSMFCGMIIYIAVNNYKKASNEIGKYIGIIM